MQNFLIELLTAVIIAVVPVITTMLVNWLRSSVANVKGDLAKKYAEEVANAVADAVTATSQVYVDELKKAELIDLDAQKHAAEMALNACLESLSPACKKFLDNAYTDVCIYLSNKIEAEVRNQKKEVL